MRLKAFMFLLVVCSVNNPMQASDFPVVMDYENHPVDFTSLKEKYGRHKIIPAKYEKQILIALSHYPELIDIKIKFKARKAFIPISSRPNATTIYRHRFKRTYTVVISEGSSEGMRAALLKNLPFNAQVGVLGHELAHTAYYIHKSKGQMLGIAISYSLSKFRAKFERDTDRRTVAHGLGWQLLAWAEALRPNGASKGDGFIDKYYLHPNEIHAYMSDTKLYSNLSHE